MNVIDNSSVVLNLSEIKENKLSICRNAKVILIGEITQDRELEITVGENSELKIYLIQKNGSLRQTNIAKNNARIHTNIIYFGGGESRISNILEGERSEAHDIEVFAINEEKKLKIDTTLLHIGKNTSGNIFVKGTARDRAIASVDGMIKIEKHASGSNSFLDEHVMLLNPGARAETNPQLEIENNDVSSRHAASVSQIDDNKIFYMMARGLTRNDARHLIIEGFLSSAIGKIDNPDVKNSVLQLMENAI